MLSFWEEICCICISKCLLSKEKCIKGKLLPILLSILAGIIFVLKKCWRIITYTDYLHLQRTLTSYHLSRSVHKHLETENIAHHNLVAVWSINIGVLLPLRSNFNERYLNYDRFGHVWYRGLISNWWLNQELNESGCLANFLPNSGR